MAATQAKDDAPKGPSAYAVKRAVNMLLAGRDLETLSLKILRREVEDRLGVVEGGLDERKEEVQSAAQSFIDAAKGSAQSQKKFNRGPKTSPRRGAKSESEDEVEDTPKKKQKITVHRLYSKEVWASVSAELAAENEGKKPGLGAISSAISSRFKALPIEEQDKYAEQAREANLPSHLRPTEAILEPMPDEDGSGMADTHKPGTPRKRAEAEASSSTAVASSPGVSKKRKGKSDEHAEPEYTRAEFQKLSTVLQARVCSMDSDGVVGPEVVEARMVPRVFSTGTVGWFHSNKMAVSLGGGRVVYCQAQFSLMAIGSKHWEAGEGYSPDAFPRDPTVQESGMAVPEMLVTSVSHVPSSLASEADSNASALPRVNGLDQTIDIAAGNDHPIRVPTPGEVVCENRPGTGFNNAALSPPIIQTASERLHLGELVPRADAADISAQIKAGMEEAPSGGLVASQRVITDLGDAADRPAEGLNASEFALVPPNGVGMDSEHEVDISADHKIPTVVVSVDAASSLANRARTNLEKATGALGGLCARNDTSPPEVMLDLANVADALDK